MNRRDALKRTALMMGYAVSASTIAAVMQGCETSGDPDWMPTYLNNDQSNLVAEIAEIILPKSDTPGAKDALVHRFIDSLFGGFMDDKKQALITEGLVAVDASSQSANNKKFVDATPEQQTAIIQKLANEATKDSFFAKIKELTLTGYFTSEVVGKNVLNYLPIPGEYKACIDIEEVGNVNWTI